MSAGRTGTERTAEAAGHKTRSISGAHRRRVDPWISDRRSGPGARATVTVDAREFRDASNPNSRAAGIAIVVKESGRLERENTSFVDADEIDSLLKGIEYIAKIGKDVTKHENFEADYKTKGDLRISVYNDPSGKISAAVASGRIGRTRAFIQMRDLEELHKLITEAKAKL